MGSQRPIIPGPGRYGMTFQKYSGPGSGTVCNFRKIPGRDPVRDNLLRDRAGMVVLLRDSSTRISWGWCWMLHCLANIILRSCFLDSTWNFLWEPLKIQNHIYIFDRLWTELKLNKSDLNHYQLMKMIRHNVVIELYHLCFAKHAKSFHYSNASHPCINAPSFIITISLATFL